MLYVFSTNLFHCNWHSCFGISWIQKINGIDIFLKVCLFDQRNGHPFCWSLSFRSTASIADERLTRMLRVLEVWSSNPEPAKSYTALQTYRHRFNVYARNCVALALCRGDGYRKLVTRASASYNEYNERFGLFFQLRLQDMDASTTLSTTN